MLWGKGKLPPPPHGQGAHQGNKTSQSGRGEGLVCLPGSQGSYRPYVYYSFYFRESQAARRSIRALPAWVAGGTGALEPAPCCFFPGGTRGSGGGPHSVLTTVPSARAGGEGREPARLEYGFLRQEELSPTPGDPSKPEAQRHRPRVRVPLGECSASSLSHESAGPFIHSTFITH